MLVQGQQGQTQIGGSPDNNGGDVTVQGGAVGTGGTGGASPGAVHLVGGGAQVDLTAAGLSLNSHPLLLVPSVTIPVASSFAWTQADPGSGNAPHDATFTGQSAHATDAKDGAGFAFNVGGAGNTSHYPGAFTIGLGAFNAGSSRGSSLILRGGPTNNVAAELNIAPSATDSHAALSITSHEALSLYAGTYAEGTQLLAFFATVALGHLQIGLYGSPPVVQSGRIGQLTDSTGGVVSSTLAAGITDTAAKNAIASLAAKLNAIESRLSSAGGGIGITA
jgi:hypothetical protein